VTSKADKRRRRAVAATKPRVGRGSQNAGRPRQEGERYPSGRLKPQKNERLIDAKRALVGDDLDIALADDPLGFIHAKGWLTTPLYRTALAYRDIRRRAHVGGPGLDAGGVQETSSTTGVQARSIRDMSDPEIAEVFDHVFRDVPDTTAEEREAQALIKWKRLEAAMTPGQRRQVSLVVLEGSWAWWMTANNLGKELVGRRLQERKDLEDGLQAMRRALRPVRLDDTKSAGASIQSIATPKSPTIVEELRFIDEDGDPVQMVSQRGRPFAVARKVRA
jgi:hypothetical protein